MMSEESKANDLEFITVDSGAATATDAPATNLKSPGGKSSKKEDAEALYVECDLLYLYCHC